jgi:uncharacterized protein (DUF1501 family)
MATFHAGEVSRREFLRAGGFASGAVGLSLAEMHRLAAAPAGETNCILLFLVGAPSQLDTLDPKPDAPTDVRGPFRPIRTNVPGVELCEHLPLTAATAHRFAVVRSVHHTAAPIHETGHQLMQTGRLSRGGVEQPHYGSVVSYFRGPRRDGAPPFAVLPGPIGNTGVSVSHGQSAGYLGSRHDPMFATDIDPAGEAEIVRDRYGWNTFGRSCLAARQLVERGTRFVTVNMFDTVFDTLSWDCHADGGSLATDLNDYKDTLCPMFDRAYSALLGDLVDRGMLANTLVVAAGEFGRTPKLNPRGGRDHWPGVWSVLFAGGGVRGGQVVGSSDGLGGEPRDRPVEPAEIAATVYHALGIDRALRLPGSDGRPVPLADAEPIGELF